MRPRRATAADLVALEHHEVIGGELVEKASPTMRHGLIQGNIAGALYGFGSHGRRKGQPGGWWLGTEITIELQDDEVYQPDLAGWRIERLPLVPEEWPMRVVPDWVCEILSPSTAARDLGHKQQIYHRARVGHYWVVAPSTYTLTVYRWQKSSYALAMTALAGALARVEPFDAIEIDIGELFGLPQQPR